MLKSSVEGRKLIADNATELGELKYRLFNQLNSYKLDKNTSKYQQLKNAMGDFFDGIKSIEQIKVKPKKYENINRSVIQDQVEMGVAVRMACMDLLARNLRLERGRKIVGTMV